MDVDQEPRQQSEQFRARRMSADTERTAAKILRLKQVMERTGFGRSWIYKSMRNGAFVRSVKIGRATGWDAAAVEAWILAKLERNAPHSEAVK